MIIKFNKKYKDLIWTKSYRQIYPLIDNFSHDIIHAIANNFSDPMKMFNILYPRNEEYFKTIFIEPIKDIFKTRKYDN